MGIDSNGYGIGEPVERLAKPNVGEVYAIEAPAASDNFADSRLGLQWQWQANPKHSWASLTDAPGVLRLFAQSLPDGAKTLYDAPNLLLQKFPALAFTMETELNISGLEVGDTAGFVIFGLQYSYIGVRRSEEGYVWLAAEGDFNEEQVLWQEQSATLDQVSLGVTVSEGAVCSYYIRRADSNPKQQRYRFRHLQASKGHWVGAKAGLFALRTNRTEERGGFADFSSFQVMGVQEIE